MRLYQVKLKLSPPLSEKISSHFIYAVNLNVSIQFTNTFYTPRNTNSFQIEYMYLLHTAEVHTVLNGVSEKDCKKLKTTSTIFTLRTLVIIGK